MFNSSRAEANTTSKSFVPHLKRMVEPDRTEILSAYPHHMLPRFNQIRTDDAPLGAFHLSAHIAAQPTPVLGRRPTQIAAHTSDPVFRLSREKDAHQTRLRQLRNRYDYFVGHRSYKKAMRNYAGRNDVHLKCVREFAEELDRDPDEHFSGDYDYYCTGSTMAVLPRPEGGDWLVHVEAANGQLNQLKLSHLSARPAKSSKAMPTAHLQANDDFDPITAALAPHGHIYDLQYAQRPDRLCVRQKFRITVIDPCQPQLLNAFANDVPFVSAAFDSASDCLITVDVQRRVHVYALGARTDAEQQPLHSGRLYTNYKSARPHDQWSAVSPFSAHVQALCDRETVRLFDVRTPFDDIQQPLYAHQFRTYMERCEQLTCMVAAPTRDNCLLIGTSHKLFAVDVRMSGSADDESVATDSRPANLLHFTHQLHSLPTMISVLATRSGQSDDGELIAVGAQLPGNVRLCETLKSAAAGSTSQFGSRALPYRPPSMWDSYQLVRRQGECLDARCLVPQQLKFCTTGVQLWRSSVHGNDADAFLLQQNSAGDVFVQALTERSGVEQPGAVLPAECTRIREAFNAWDLQLQELANPSTAVDANDTEACDADDVADEANGSGSANEHAGGKELFFATDLTNFRGMADVVAHNVCNPYGVGGCGMVDIPSAIPAGTAAVKAVDADPSERPPRWRKPLKHLRLYVDALAPCLLDVWQMPEEDGDGRDDQAEVGKADGRSKADRISAWLERTSTQQDPEYKLDDLDVSVSTIGVGLTQPETTKLEQELTPEDTTVVMDDLKAVDKLLVPDEVIEKGAVDRVAFVISEDMQDNIVRDTTMTLEPTMLELTLDDTTQMYEDPLPVASGRPAKKKAKKVRAFVPGF